MPARVLLAHARVCLRSHTRQTAECFASEAPRWLRCSPLCPRACYHQPWPSFSPLPALPLIARLVRFLSQGTHAAVGGENADVIVWDVAAEKQVFKARAPPLDWVGMYKKIFVSSLSFLPGAEPNRIIAGDDRCVRVFDFRAQRRAVLTIEFGETIVKAVALTPGAGGACLLTCFFR